MEFPASFFVHCSQVAGVSTAAKCSRSPAEKFASLHLQINLHRLRHRQVTLAQSHTVPRCRHPVSARGVHHNYSDNAYLTLHAAVTTAFWANDALNVAFNYYFIKDKTH